MSRVTVHGLTAADRALRDRARRIRDLTPAMKEGARLIEKETDDSFRKQRSPLGEPWATLKPSTIAGRAARIKSKKIRSAILAGGVTPLVDTGRMRNSVHVKATKRQMRFSAVGYMGPHMTGGGPLPKRNPTVFEFATRWQLVPHVRERLTQIIRRHIGGRP